MKRALLVGLILVPLAVAGAGWFFLPGWIEGRASRAIASVGASLEVAIEYDKLILDGMERVILTGVRVTPGDALPTEGALCELDRVVVDIGLGSLTERKVRLENVTVEGARVSLVRRSDGTDNFGALRARLERMLGPAKEGATGGESDLWRYLDKRIPTVETAGAFVSVEDRSDDRTLIPRALPARLELPGVSVTATNASRMTDRLKLEVQISAELPLLDSRGTARLEYDRSNNRTTVEAHLDRPATYVLNGRTLSVQQVNWLLGDWIRLGGVKVGSQLEAASVAIQLAKPAERTGEGPLRWIRKVEVNRPRVVVGEGGLEALLAAVTRGRSHPVPAAEGKVRPPSGKRPKLSKKGVEVREGISGAFESAAARARKLGAVAWSAGSRFPLPELSIKLGQLVYPDAATGDEAALRDAVQQFDLEVTRAGEEMVEASLSLPSDGVAGGKSAEILKARLQLDTGDLQVQLHAQSLPLHPWRALLPSAVTTTPETRLQDTRLRFMYSAESDRLEVHGEAHVEALTVTMKRLAADPMEGVSLGGKLNAVLDLAAARLSVTETQLKVGAVPVDVTFDAHDLSQSAILNWHVRVPRIAGQAVVDALPSAFLGKLAGLKLKGDIAWDFKGYLDTRDMDSLKYEAQPESWGFEVDSLGDAVSFSRLRKRFVHRVREGDGTEREFSTGPGSGNWVPLDSVSPWLAKVLTTTEDGTFWRHDGIAFFAIRDAAIDNLEKGKFYRGASTLTQQLVKNVFLEREKTIARKLQEMFLSWRLEQYLSKRQILALYLNVIELGPGIYGIRRASRHYFDKHPKELTLVECAFLASILPNPRKYHYMFRRGEVTENWRKGLERIIAVMEKRGKVTSAQMRGAAPYAPVFRRRGGKK